MVVSTSNRDHHRWQLALTIADAVALVIEFDQRAAEMRGVADGYRRSAFYGTGQANPASTHSELGGFGSVAQCQLSYRNSLINNPDAQSPRGSKLEAFCKKMTDHGTLRLPESDNL